MKHNKIKELVKLYACDELSKKEIEIVENHLLECEECTNEFASMKQLYFAFTENAPDPAGDHILEQARDNLMDSIFKQTIQNEKIKKPMFDKLFNLISTPVRFSFSAAALLLIGIFAGNLLFNSGYPELRGDSLDNIDYNSVDISNVKFNQSANNNEIEVSFNNITPVTIKGKFEDNKIQQLLAKALVSGNNPGIKIKTLNAFVDQQKKEIKPNKAVKNALIKSLKSDKNDGVRKQALNVLMNYPLDNEIQEAFLSVLSNDLNPGLRVMAINALADDRSQGDPISDELFRVLSKKAESDKNSFVRLKAANLIKGEK